MLVVAVVAGVVNTTPFHSHATPRRFTPHHTKPHPTHAVPCSPDPSGAPHQVLTGPRAAPPSPSSGCCRRWSGQPRRSWLQNKRCSPGLQRHAASESYSNAAKPEKKDRQVLARGQAFPLLILRMTWLAGWLAASLARSLAVCLHTDDCH